MDPYLSEIRIFSFGFAPKGWSQCNGQTLSIAQNQALFALLGTTYGGDGRTTFLLPNLAGRAAMSVGTGFVQGQTGGEANHTLTINEIPQHNHLAIASSNAAGAGTPANNFWASGAGSKPYSNTPNTQMAAAALGAAGGSQPHNNLPPYLTVNFCIALQGIFPSRN